MQIISLSICLPSHPATAAVFGCQHAKRHQPAALRAWRPVVTALHQPSGRLFEIATSLYHTYGHLHHRRCQLALALHLACLLPSLALPPQYFDPVFTPLDGRILTALGGQLIAIDEGGARPAGVATFFYLPHCEGALCDALLAANWSAERLGRIAVLGNSFSSYHERWSLGGGATANAGMAVLWHAALQLPRSSGGSREAVAEVLFIKKCICPPLILHYHQHTPAVPPPARPAPAGIPRPERLLQLVAAGAVLELPVRDGGFHVASAFNDMALHVFPRDRLARMGL